MVTSASGELYERVVDAILDSTTLRLATRRADEGLRPSAVARLGLAVPFR